ncbi:class I SAM-dependent methyltransferase [Actinocatenispora rupis]|uniref:Methyltransferase type 11 n=1 Tax=Actinocatenispora rupis TaxID=519421 RepID=A0A8J3JGI6_9ACTN|nr:class I SAM-dependent methyltransferase [Actinocatenispora rupis]GID14463.1 methyltransferase type 11 [Actinocatenispora rupis]
MSKSHPTAAEVEAARDDPKQANILYHDWEADTYDEKWSISYDERCVTYARDRFAHVAGTDGWPYRNALELGCGTGFFLLNLMQAGVIEKGYVTDISPGMVDVALRNAKQLGLDVSGRVSDAETIAYDDATFDLVVGHAMLHHIPDVEQALREVLRVLRPGGRFVFCGEPTKVGDWYARKLGQATWWATTNLTKLPGLTDWRRPQEELDESSQAAALEAVVDLHTFDPHALRRTAESAGAIDVEVATDELTAAFLGWPVRTFEAAVPKEKLGWGWARFAYTSWKALSAVDEKVLSRVVPKEFFYNVEITGVKP